MLHYFPVGAHKRETEKAIAEGEVRLVGSLGCILGAGRAAGAASAGARAQGEFSAKARRWSQAQAGSPGVRGDRVCAAHGVSVEGAAERSVWQRQCDPQTLSGMGKRGIFSSTVASGPSRVRGHGGYRLALAKRRWGPAEGPAGARIGRTQPDGSGEKMGASECFWSTPMASRCLSS